MQKHHFYPLEEPLAEVPLQPLGSEQAVLGKWGKRFHHFLTSRQSDTDCKRQCKMGVYGQNQACEKEKGAQTKSGRCTGELKIQKVFAFVVIRQTYIHTCTESLLHSNLQDRILAISVTILLIRGANSFSKSITRPRN